LVRAGQITQYITLKLFTIWTLLTLKGRDLFMAGPEVQFQNDVNCRTEMSGI